MGTVKAKGWSLLVRYGGVIDGLIAQRVNARESDLKTRNPHRGASEMR